MDQEEEIRYDQIERYLDGSMDGEERIAFEKRILTDKVLEQALEDERLVRAAMRRVQEQELRAKIRQWRENTPDKEDKRPFFFFNAAFWRDWRLWLLVLLAAGLLAWLIYSGKEDKTPPSDPGPGQSSELEPSPQSPAALPPAQDNVKLPDQAGNLPVRTKSNKKKNLPGHKAPEKKALLDQANRDNLTAAELESLAQSYVTYSISNSPTKSANGDTPAGSISIKTQASQAIRDSAFAEALRLLRQADSTDVEVRRMTAEALFGSRRYAEAAPLFRSLSGNLLYGVDARKNLVLCYLAQYPREQETFRREFNLLLSSPSPTLSGWAKDLDKQLKKLR